MDQNPSEQVNPAPVISATPPISPKAKGNTMKELILIIVLLVVLAGVSYGSYWGYSVYQTKQITLSKVFTTMANHIKNGDIKSAEITSAIEVTVAGGNSVGADSSSQYSEALSQINNIKTNISFNGILDGTTKGSVNSYGKLTIDLNIDAKSGSPYASISGAGPLAIELEYYAFPGSTYFKINKVPSFAGMYLAMVGINLSEYLNTWILVDQKSVDAFSKSFVKNDTKMSIEEAEKVQGAVVEFLDRSGAFSITDTKDETTVDGKSVTALYISMNNEKFLTGLVKLVKDMKEIFPTELATVDTEKLSDSPELLKSLKDISITNFKLLVGSDGYFYGNSALVTIAASGSTPLITESLSDSITNYNKEFNLQKPAGARDINLILMDIAMPGMDGYEATRMIRQFNPHIVIIAQSANSVKYSKGQALEMGCNDFVTKPFDQQTLDEMIRFYFPWF